MLRLPRRFSFSVFSFRADRCFAFVIWEDHAARLQRFTNIHKHQSSHFVGLWPNAPSSCPPRYAGACRMAWSFKRPLHRVRTSLSGSAIASPGTRTMTDLWNEKYVTTVLITSTLHQVRCYSSLGDDICPTTAQSCHCLPMVLRRSTAVQRRIRSDEWFSQRQLRCL
jgi:hypothetical protein